jgi:eukaryotic-like serine/threonine-protein kinase
VLRGQMISEGSKPYELWRQVLRWLVLVTELSDLEASVLKTLIPDIQDLLGRAVAEAPEIDAQASWSSWKICTGRVRASTFWRA